MSTWAGRPRRGQVSDRRSHELAIICFDPFSGLPIKGTFYTILAVTDVFMVKSAVTAGGKLIGAGAAKAIGMMTAKEAGEVAIESAAKAGAESGAEIISRTAQEQANKGVNYLRKFMTDKEWRAFSKDPANGSRFLGKAVHEATAAALEAAYPGRFKYYRLGIDFLDKATGFMIELTTEGQVLPHMARDGYDGALYALYTLMNVL